MKIVALLLAMLFAVPAFSQEFAVHGQATFVEQLDGKFNDPYNGPNSLTQSQHAETIDATLFLGARLWSNAELWLNTTIDQGFGLDNTLGLAGFSSGEAYKVGRSHPYFRFDRYFIRQTINLGGESQSVEETANQFGNHYDANRLVFTIGKISVPDIFDANDYAHDPRHDFLNWSAIDVGSFDYGAESWGYTTGAVVEWYQGKWALRAGLVDLSIIPNSETLDPGFHQFEILAELERRWQSGKIVFTRFQNRGRMALLTNINDRQYRTRTGISANIQQAITDNLGWFARAGKASGNVEVYEFSDIDQSVSSGFSIKGTRWGRPSDTIGIVVIRNSISAEREQFLNGGGLGLLIGDGQLPRPRAEQIGETYYDFGFGHVHAALDYQYVVNPAYNSDRGPISILGIRLHAQF